MNTTNITIKIESDLARDARAARQLWQDGNGLISTQVLQEFHVNVRRKANNPISPAQKGGAAILLRVSTCQFIAPPAILCDDRRPAVLQ